MGILRRRAENRHAPSICHGHSVNAYLYNMYIKIIDNNRKKSNYAVVNDYFNPNRYKTAVYNTVDNNIIGTRSTARSNNTSVQ